MSPVAPMPYAAAVGVSGLKSWVMVFSGELSMIKGGELAEELAAGSTVSSPALSRLAVAAARTFRLNNVFPFNLPLLKKGRYLFNASGHPNPSLRHTPFGLLEQLWRSNIQAPASRRASRGNPHQRRVLAAAAVLHKGAPGIKRAAFDHPRGAVGTTNRLLTTAAQYAPEVVGVWRGGDEKLGVRVGRLLCQLFGRARSTIWPAYITITSSAK